VRWITRPGAGTGVADALSLIVYSLRPNNP
jgi:hypothetical protein